MSGYVPITVNDPWVGWGDEMRRRDAFADAGNALTSGNYEGARNALLSRGYNDAAHQMQQIQDAADQNRRMNAQEGRTVEDRALAKSVGSLYASGDTEEAKKAALRGGNLDLAKGYTAYENAAAEGEAAEAKRQAMAKAAQLTAAGDINGARAVLLPHFATPEALMTEAANSQKAVAEKVGQLALAYRDNPEGWSTEAIPTLRRMGINPEGFEGPAGLNRALAESGLASTTFKTDAALELAKAKANVSGNADTRRAQAMLASFQADNPGVPVPSTAYQQIVASKNHMLTVSEGPDGQKIATAVLVDARTKTAVDAAERIVNENKAWNDAHPDQPQKPTDFATVYRQARGQDIQQQNANTRASMANPERRGEIATATKLGQLDAGQMQRASSAAQAMNHLSTLEALANLPSANDALAPIQKVGGYQTFANLANSGRIEIPAELAMMRQAASVAAREIANAAHVPGTGGETNERNREMRESLESLIMDSPNAEVLRRRIANLRAIAKGYVGAPLPSELYKNEGFQAQRREEAQRGVQTLQQPEVNGQIPPLPPGGAAPAQPMRVYDPATGQLKPAGGP